MCVPECACAAWRSQYLRRLARNIPSPACGGRCPKGGRGDKNPALTPLEEPGIYAAWHDIPSPRLRGKVPGGRKVDKNPVLTPLEEPVFTPLGTKDSFPACGGRFPEGGRGIKIPHLRRLNAKPATTPLECEALQPCCLMSPVFTPLGTKYSFPRLRGKVPGGRKGGMKIQHLRRLKRTQ